MPKQFHRRQFLAAVGSSVLPLGCTRKDPGMPAGGELVKATDSRSQVRLPEGWSVQTDLNDQADLQVGDKRRQAFLVILTEMKGDFADGMTCQEFTRRKLTRFQAVLEGVEIGKGPVELTVGGRPAVQYELKAIATRDRLRLFYLLTGVDGNQAFHQLLAWTSASREAENRGSLEQSILGFSDLS